MNRKFVNFCRAVAGMDPVSDDLAFVPFPVFNGDVAPMLKERAERMVEQMGKQYSAAPGSTFRYIPSGPSVLRHTK